MKLTNGITLFNKQSYKMHKINKNDILEKNCNFSVPIIENANNTNNKTQKKKIIDGREKEKVTLIKSFCNKNERNSRSKSNSNSKEYKKRYKSNNINNKINSNIYSNNNTSYNNQINQINKDNKKYIFSSYILTPIFGMKIYENTVDKIFEYIKNILPKKIYIDIKKTFIKYIFEELHIKNNLLLSKTEAEIMNINLKLFYNKTTSVNRSNSKNKNQKDFSFTRNHNNNRTMNNHNYNTAKNNFSKQYIFNGLLKNHNSLYSLNKKCAKIHGVPFTFNISKSPRKSRSKSGSKDKKLINKNNNYYSNNNIFDPDLHVFKILNQRKKNVANKNFNNTSKNKKIKKQLNSNLILSKKNKNSNIIKNKISNTIIYSDKKNDIINNNNKSIRVRENSNKIIPRKNEVKDSNINEDIVINNKNENNKKNDEQLKQIKSGLDENLKFLFNFSYENFLNKESESESKKSASDYNNIEHSNQKDNNFNKDDINNNKAKENFYQPKYNI